MADPVLKWSGAKWSIADWIVSHLPAHTCYLEPYFGSGAVFFTKTPSPFETLNDLSSDVVNLFRVIRERPDELIRAVELTPWAREEYEQCRTSHHEGDALEQARRFLVCCWQQIGARQGREGWTGGWRTQRIGHSSPTGTWQRLPLRIAAAALRLRDAQIECRPAPDLIARYRDPSVLIYADPPYLLSTRSRAMYAYEMSEADHWALLEALDRHPGPVLLSSYANPIYEARLAHWRCLSCRAEAQSHEGRTELLWLNREACRRAPTPPLALDWLVR